MLCDQTRIRFIAGKGGNGMAHFLKAKFVPKGGPDGGDGGRGGNLILKADENCRTLIDLHRKRNIKAQDGENGGTEQKTGKTGEDLIVIVPAGTMIYSPDKKELIADLTQHGQEFQITKGGKGGYGNTHFKSSRYQVPQFSELGEPGEEKEVLLELRMIADVGVIGLPSAGKSSFLNYVTRAQAKVAAYPFTTLIPNLGVADLTKILKEPGASFIMADIPGLIEGASEGKGLGHEFLRHITRTKILIHLIDIEDEDPEKAKEIIDNELAQFDKKLKRKKQIVAFNKVDLFDEEKKKELKKKWKKMFFISAATGEGVEELLKETYKVLKQEEGKMTKKAKKEESEKGEEHKTFRPYEDSPRAFQIKKLKKIGKIRQYLVTGRRIEQVSIMANIAQPDGLMHLRHLVKKLGIQRALLREG
ncbi:MAG: GTPase ObgE, partial [Patescibacteria group bacterium]